MIVVCMGISSSPESALGFQFAQGLKLICLRWTSATNAISIRTLPNHEEYLVIDRCDCSDSVAEGKSISIGFLKLT